MARDPAVERRRVTRLFNRAGFGASVAEINQWTALGYEATVDHLLNFSPSSTGLGQADAALEQQQAVDDYPETDVPGLVQLQAWWLNRMATTTQPLEEKLTLYWHGHFTSGFSKVSPASLLIAQNELLRSFARGNFRDLCKAVTADAAMLFWLDGATNMKGNPNENYAREFMELFTLGKDRYTQQDVREAARAFTGHRAQHDGNVTFVPGRHDPGIKTLLAARGAWGPSDVTDIVLSTGPIAAQHLATRMASFFHHAQPEPAVVNDMAAAFLHTGYEVTPMLRALFERPEFKDSPTHTIKSPAEFVAGTIKALNLGQSYLWGAAAGAMGQQLFNPPNVAGWPGGAAWADTAASLARYNFATTAAVSATSNLVQVAVDNAGGMDAITRTWMDRLGLFDLLPATAAAIARYVKDSRAAKVDPQAITRGILALLIASPDYNLR